MVPTFDEQVDRIHWDSPDLGSVHARLGGRMGLSIGDAAQNGLGRVSVDSLLRPFEVRDEGEAAGFRGEFWGKWALSVMDAIDLTGATHLEELLTESVDRIIDSQDEFGYIGTYADAFRLSAFDIWDSKYTIWALLHFAIRTGRADVKEACLGSVDELASTLASRGARIVDSGLSVLEGSGSASILIVLEHIVTAWGHSTASELVDQIIEDLSDPRGPGLLHVIAGGSVPASWPSAKAYEIMSCLEGAAAYARRTKSARLGELVVHAVEQIARHEITIIGSGSNQELWANSAHRQTSPTSKPHETCVTVHWMRLCLVALHLTRNAWYAEALEVSLHNALLGAMSADASWWAYFVPLSGAAAPSPLQFADVQCSCCVANGYRGLMMTAGWVVEATDLEVTFNSYLEGTYRCATGGEGDLTLGVRTEYPREGTVIIDVLATVEAAAVTLRFRVPSWARGTTIAVNGDIMMATGESGWVELQRLWRKGDVVELTFPTEARLVRSAFDEQHVAVMRGPLVMALDTALAAPLDELVWIHPETDLGTARQVDHRYCVIDPLFQLRSSHYFGWSELRIAMSDFASACSASMTGGSRYRVWIPQPLLHTLGYAFAGEASQGRPGLPAIIQFS